MCLYPSPWSSLVVGGEGSDLPNCQTTLVIALDALSLLFCIFINTTAYHLDRHEPSPPTTKELHAFTIGRTVTMIHFFFHVDALKNTLKNCQTNLDPTSTREISAQFERTLL